MNTLVGERKLSGPPFFMHTHIIFFIYQKSMCISTFSFYFRFVNDFFIFLT